MRNNVRCVIQENYLPKPVSSFFSSVINQDGKQNLVCLYVEYRA